MNTNMFDFEKAEASAGWIKELENEHIPETEEYGIGSFVFEVSHLFILKDFCLLLLKIFRQILLEVRVYFGLPQGQVKL